MGYAASSKAFKTLDRLMVQKRLETGSTGSNYWTDAAGHMVFFEVGREQKDGAITGSVHRETRPGNGQGKRAGGFRVEPDGMISRFPCLTKAEIAALNAFADGAMFVAV